MPLKAVRASAPQAPEWGHPHNSSCSRPKTKTEPAKKSLLLVCCGNPRRHFCRFAFKAVSYHRRSAQALLTLASPSAQVTISPTIRLCCPYESC